MNPLSILTSRSFSDSCPAPFLIRLVSPVELSTIPDKDHDRTGVLNTTKKKKEMRYLRRNQRGSFLLGLQSCYCSSLLPAEDLQAGCLRRHDRGSKSTYLLLLNRPRLKVHVPAFYFWRDTKTTNSMTFTRPTFVEGGTMIVTRYESQRFWPSTCNRDRMM